MLSVLLMEADDAVAHLVRFYAPAAKSLLDITYGKGTLVRALSGVEVCGCDLNPKALPQHRVVQGDFRTMPLPACDVGLYDPPYLYGRKSEVLYQRRDADWQEQHTSAYTPEDFSALANDAARKLHLYTQSSIVKVMNSRLKGKLVDNRQMVKEAFVATGWELRDELVYVRLGVGVFRNGKTAQVAHGFYLIFGKEMAA